MSTQPVTTDQFAAKLKAKYPQYASIPDTELVQKVVAKYPQYKAQLGGASPGAPSVDMQDSRPQGLTDRILTRMSDNQEGMAQMPGAIAKDARSRFLARHPENASQSFMEKVKALPDTGADAVRSLVEGAYYQGAAPAGEGLYNVTAGIPGRIADIAQKKEDPAALAGDAAMFYLPGGEDTARETYGPTHPTKAGSLFGAMTRGKDLMDRVDSAAKDVPINHTPVYEWAKKAQALEAYGYTLPGPVKAFINMVESRMKPGSDPIIGSRGGPTGILEKSRMDRGAQLNPLTYQDARNFEQALGAKIPWDQDPGGKMGGLMKKMRESLGNETATALQPYGLDIPYKRAKAEFQKAYGAKAKWGPIGRIGGHLAGVGGGSVVGHPLALGYAGGGAGESLAGSMVDRMANAGRKSAGRTPVAETGFDAATRRATGGVSPIEQMKVAADQVNSLKMQVERQRAAGDAGVYNTVSKLREAQDKMAQAKQAYAEGQRAGMAKYGDLEKRLRDTANPVRDTDLISKIKREHPEWSLSQQLMEAAKRVKESGK